jgi:hypothetical protein
MTDGATYSLVYALFALIGAMGGVAFLLGLRGAM